MTTTKISYDKYDYMPGKEIKDGKIINFERWEYQGHPAYDLDGLSKEEEGIYFKPDTKYTPEHHDIWYDFTLASISA